MKQKIILRDKKETLPGRESDHSSSSIAEGKNGGAIPPLPICRHGIKRRDSVTYYVLHFESI
jgi:hypothetical protein